MLSIEEQKDIKNKINNILSKYFTEDFKKNQKVPRILNQEAVDYVINSSGKWIIIAFISINSIKKFDEYFEKYRDPFPGLLVTIDTPMPIAFNLKNSSYNYFKDNVIKNMYSFKVEDDCSFILENHHQIIKTSRGEDIDYIIDLAYIITFTEKININNFYEVLDPLIKHSLSIWGKI